MNLLEKSDDEIIKIANPIWSNLVKSSNIKDYGGFTKDFSSQMLKKEKLSWKKKELLLTKELRNS